MTVSRATQLRTFKEVEGRGMEVVVEILEGLQELLVAVEGHDGERQETMGEGDEGWRGATAMGWVTHGRWATRDARATPVHPYVARAGRRQRRRELNELEAGTEPSLQIEAPGSNPG